MKEQQFARSILTWYGTNQRSVPWRRIDISPYEVVISEFMLQQTQVSRVAEKLPEFLKKFPTIFDLARAPKAEVIIAWQGLGYNRRALQLHELAKEIVTKYNGIIPTTKEEIRSLPGVGSYMTGSILSFAYNLPEPAIDVNVRRIFLRYFECKDQGLPMSKKEEDVLFKLVLKTIPHNKSCNFHNALMDFGSLVCLRAKPLCSICPLQKTCHFFPRYQAHGSTALYVAEKKQEKGISENGKHIPNRIFRGRIIEWVRKNNGVETTLSELGHSIKKDYQNKEETWLLSLCEKLEEEGFVKAKKKDEKITLTLAS